MTPNKQVLRGYAELALQGGKQSIQVPVRHKQFKEEPLESSVNVKSYREKREQVEQGRWQNMKSLEERKIQNNAKLIKL